MDNSGNMKSLADKINPNWYSITIISTVILGILMLFYKELSSNIKDYLIPALVVYILGTSIIGYYQGAFFRANGMKEGFKEPLWLYYTLHSLWFLLLIMYLTLYKNVI
jgi:hypothetical protein